MLEIIIFALGLVVGCVLQIWIHAKRFIKVDVKIGKWKGADKHSAYIPIVISNIGKITIDTDVVMTETEKWWRGRQWHWLTIEEHWQKGIKERPDKCENYHLIPGNSVTFALGIDQNRLAKINKNKFTFTVNNGEFGEIKINPERILDRIHEFIKDQETEGKEIN